MAEVMGQLGRGSDPDESTQFRRIEFHLARKPFKGFNSDGGDFRPETLNPGGGSSSSSSGGLEARKAGVAAAKGGSGSGLKRGGDGSEYLENGLDPELSFPITFRKIGAGLINMGNTCYLNSVLQCLTYTEPLAAYLQSGRHRSSCHIKKGFCALCAIQEHVSLALQSTKSILPKALVFNLQRISRNFRKSRQEDAHEYMVNLLESMHKCCLPSGVPSESPSAYEKSLVHKIFGGRLRSRVKCLHCSHCSDKLDPFLDLSLEIAKANSLHKALVNFTAEEQLDGGERHYQCQRCNQKVRATKQMTIHKPPNVLSIHLKRFRAHDPGQKINKEVQFAPKLDLRPFVSEACEGDLKYTLYGVLVHCGASTYSGHYYCFVRTSTGIWHSLDDNNVRSVREMTVLEQKAYMLFYVRDRRNIIPRKPVDVAQKEYIKSNSNGNKIAPVDNHVSKQQLAQKVSVEGRSSILASSNAKKDASIIVPRVAHLKEVSVNRNNGQIMSENMIPKTDSLSKVPLSKGSSGGLEKDMLPSCKGDTTVSVNAMAATSSASINDCNVKVSSKQNASDSVLSPTVKDPETPQASKSFQDAISQNNALVSCAENLGGAASSTVPSGLTLEKMPTVKSSDPPSSTISQVESFTGESDAPTLGQKTGDGQKVVVDESAKMSGLSVVTKRSLHAEAPNCKQPKKLKKKNMMCKVAGMHFRTCVLSRAILGVRKKKNKRSKQMTSDCKSRSKKHSNDSDCISSDLGPSTSEKTQTLSLVSARSKRKRSKSGLKKDADESSKTCVLESRVKNKEFGDGLGQNGTVHASDKQLQNGFGSCSVSMENQRESDRTGTPQNCKGDPTQSGSCDVPTLCPVETVVETWDGIELPQSHVVESSPAQSLPIGYIGDEWDDEIDRGKRKKVRQQKIITGGSNPFQVLANREAQLKKPRINRFSSGNQPFRI